MCWGLVETPPPLSQAKPTLDFPKSLCYNVGGKGDKPTKQERETDMTKKEIERNIKREKAFIDKTEAEILDLKAAVKCARKALVMWQDELLKVSRPD